MDLRKEDMIARLEQKGLGEIVDTVFDDENKIIAAAFDDDEDVVILHYNSEGILKTEVTDWMYKIDKPYQGWELEEYQDMNDGDLL